jgi:exodeoxyribonuclease VII large subunit
MDNTSTYRKILSVYELTSQIKKLLEDNFPLVWITGETSNFRVPASGHFYFSLKDERAQINAVMFRGQNMSLKFELEDGMQINGLGRISVYEPRGTYQIILEYLEPSGIGALQIAFEQLKAKLAQEGLFDETHKQPLPFLPEKICIITSPSGAAVHDILQVLNRRFPNVGVYIVPVKVQGEGAEEEIVNGIRFLNDTNLFDVAILARGGGSLEDLQPFNSEGVARAIFASSVPIISAVGHETDYTLADFAADVRMPTPSAAAEIVVPVKAELCETCAYLRKKILTAFFNYLRFNHTRIVEVTNRLRDPRKRIQDLRLRMDDLGDRLTRTFNQDIRLRRERTGWQTEKLRLSNPVATLSKLNNKLQLNYNNLLFNLNNLHNKIRSDLLQKTEKLQAMSPKAILKRGYSITRTVPDKLIVRDADVVQAGQQLEILLGQGSLDVTVDSGRRE